MRASALVVTVMLLSVAPAWAQTPAPEAHPYGLDPYRPSDLWLLRSFGATLVAQTPLLELRKLDPYRPSHAALLRQLGGGLPLWGLGWYPPPQNPAPLSPFPAAPAPGALAAPGVSPPGTNVVVIVVNPGRRRVPQPQLPERVDGLRTVSAPGTEPSAPHEVPAARSFGEGFDFADVLRQIRAGAEAAAAEGE